jgi:uncharacterized membrane protein YdjX (TVP38/TMEM64 family)
VPERWWWLRPLILLAVVSAGVVLALTVGIPPIDELRSGVAAAGWAAPVLYAAIFAGLTLTPAPAPASVASIAAGVLFGFATGLIIVMAGALASAVVAFGLARMLGRAAVERVTAGGCARLTRCCAAAGCSR